jgi:cell division protein FtsB
MKKVIIGFAISLILLTATPVSAVGFREWDKAVNDIITLQEQQAQSEAVISNLTTRVAQLEQENTALKNRIGIIESAIKSLQDNIMAGLRNILAVLVAKK